MKISHIYFCVLIIVLCIPVLKLKGMNEADWAVAWSYATADRNMQTNLTFHTTSEYQERLKSKSFKYRFRAWIGKKLSNLCTCKKTKKD